VSRIDSSTGEATVAIPDFTSCTSSVSRPPAACLSAQAVCPYGADLDDRRGCKFTRHPIQRAIPGLRAQAILETSVLYLVELGNPFDVPLLLGMAVSYHQSRLGRRKVPSTCAST
jgi:hypothetical protein